MNCGRFLRPSSAVTFDNAEDANSWLLARLAVSKELFGAGEDADDDAAAKTTDAALSTLCWDEARAASLGIAPAKAAPASTAFRMMSSSSSVMLSPRRALPTPKSPAPDPYRRLCWMAPFVHRTELATKATLLTSHHLLRLESRTVNSDAGSSSSGSDDDEDDEGAEGGPAARLLVVGAPLVLGTAAPRSKTLGRLVEALSPALLAALDFRVAGSLVGIISIIREHPYHTSAP